MDISTPMREAFILGIIFGVCMTLLLLMIAIALYVRYKGGFSITPPVDPIKFPWSKDD